MPWTLSGKTIHAAGGDDQGAVLSRYAVQEVLDATQDTLNFWGAGSDRRTLRFMLDESENSSTGLSGLKTAVRTDANVALVSDQGAEGNYRIIELTWTRVQDLDVATPVYMCQAQLIKA